jgi:hypothetical protein
MIDADKIHMPEPLRDNSLTRGTSRKMPTNPYITVGIAVINCTSFLRYLPYPPGFNTPIKNAHPMLKGKLMIKAKNAITQVPNIMDLRPNNPWSGAQGFVSTLKSIPLENTGNDSMIINPNMITTTQQLKMPALWNAIMAIFSFLFIHFKV